MKINFNTKKIEFHILNSPYTSTENPEVSQKSPACKLQSTNLIRQLCVLVLLMRKITPLDTLKLVLDRLTLVFGVLLSMIIP